MKIKNIILMIALLLPVFACNKLPGSGSSGEQNNGDIDVNISVVAPLPDQENFVATKLPFSDTEIRSIDVLVFDENGKFFRRVKVHQDSLTQTAVGAKFVIRLPATTKKRILHIVANGSFPNDRLNFESLSVGVHESTAIANLRIGAPVSMTGPNDWSFQVEPLIMWSRTELNGITLNSKKEGVKLLRSTAAIVVKSLSGFLTISSITIVGGASTGFLAPATYTGSVSTPSSPNPTGDKSLPYANAWTEELVGDPIQYVYERECTASDYMTIIVKADYKQYGEDITCYYKILLKDASGNPVNIVRNHRYIVKITVDPPNYGSGMGYSNLADALANPPSNGVKVDVHDEHDDFTGIVADQNSFMSLSNTEIVHLAKEGAVHQELLLFTVYSSRNITPVLKMVGNPSIIESLRVVPKGGNKFDVMGKFSQNTINGTATLLVRCDNLVQFVHSIIPNKFTFPMTPISLVGSLSAHGYTITDYDEAYVVNPDSTPWLRLKKSASDPGEYTSLKKMFFPNAFLSVKNIGSSSIGRIDASIKSQISGNDPKQVSVRIYVLK